MAIRKISRRARVGLKVLRNEGSLSFVIKSLQKVQSKTAQGKQVATGQHPIYVKAQYQDVLQADLKRPPAPWPGTDKKKLTFNWLMPPPGKGSGGHLNIFRFIKFLEEAGHTNRIYLYAQDGKGPIADILAVMGDSYPVLEATNTMQWLHNADNMEPADGIFATSWETAYPVYNTKLNTRRFYFVQDFEPYFYPMGSFHALAENTYRFGFYGVTAGGFLAKKLHRDYGMQTDHFNFGSDEKLYTFQNDKRRKEILFYVRPYTERRGFEMGIMALDIFHKKHPDYIINLVGWDVSGYKIPFPYNNLKTLELHELDALYNKCIAGLILSFTNMSLLPLEVLGSGTIPVVNDGENNRLVSDNPYIAYTNATPAALADSLSQIVSRTDGPKYAKKAADSVAQATWAESGHKFVKIVERETRRHAA